MAIFFPSACPSSYRPFLNASMRVAMKGAEIAVRNPIRGTFVGCCASANVPAARTRSVTIQWSLLIMAFTFQRKVMPQNETFENHNFMDEDGYGTVSFLLRGSSRFDSVRSSLYRATALMEFYLALCSPSYCSAPHTWQTVAHRLMRDRHRRQILNRLRHHKNDDASAVKTRIMTFGSIASHLSCRVATQRVLV